MPFGGAESVPIWYLCSLPEWLIKWHHNWAFRIGALSGCGYGGRGPEGFAEELIGQSADQFRYSLHKALLCSLRPWRGPPGGRALRPVAPGLSHTTHPNRPSA